MKILACILFVCATCIETFGQEFRGEANLPSIQKDGFYRILLSPEILTQVNDQLTDIRVYEGDGSEVPYLLESEKALMHSRDFLQYEIMSRETKRGCCTSLTLRNQRKTPINNIHLVMKNADAAREALLMGSDDRENWFTLVDRFEIDAPANDQNTQQIKTVEFPWSNYEFYLLEIRDSVHAPLNILSAGYFEDRTTNGQYQALQAKVDAKDSLADKRTYVDLLIDGLQFVDKLEVVVSGAKYYRRDATLFEKRVRTRTNGTRDEYYNPVTTFEVTSGRTAVVSLPALRASHLRIEIENHDNPPLQISTVKAFQLNRYITAWLSADESYTLRVGQPKLGAPVYDIAYFKDSIPNQPAILQVQNFEVLPEKQAAGSDATFFTSKTIIWIAIVGIAAVLGIMSVRLIKEQSGK